MVGDGETMGLIADFLQKEPGDMPLFKGNGFVRLGDPNPFLLGGDHQSSPGLGQGDNGQRNPGVPRRQQTGGKLGRTAVKDEQVGQATAFSNEDPAHHFPHGLGVIVPIPGLDHEPPPAFRRGDALHKADP